MPSISSCPACHRDITLPNDVAPQRRLRCPLCNAPFLAETVLATSTPAPPEVLFEVAEGEPRSSSLLAFGDRLDEIVGGESRFWNTSPETAAPAAEIRGEDKSSVVWPAADTASAGDAPQWDASRDEPAASASQVSPFAPRKDVLDASRDEPAASAAPDDRAPDDGVMDERAIDGEAAADQDNAATAEDEIGAGPGDESVDAPVGSFNIAAKPRSKPASIGIFGQFVGMVGGGIIGLALGYYVLLWIGGARADFLDIREKLPRWLVPRERGRNPSTDDMSPLRPRRPSKARHGDQEPLVRSSPPLVPTPEADQGVVLTAATIDPASPEIEAERAIGRSLVPAENQPLGPSQFTAHSPAELAAALASVGGELGCEHCGGTGIVRRMAASRVSPSRASPSGAGQPGSRSTQQAAGRRARCAVCDGKPSGKLTLDLFDQLCDLAEVATFTRVEPTQPDWERLRNEAQRILFRIGNDHDKAQIAGRLAGPRLDDSRRLSNGIVLAGTVHDAGEEGRLYRTRLVLFGRPLMVTIMSLHAPTPALAVHDRVIMLGSIIDSPRDNLGGYVGALPQVVWGGLALKLD
ncbi:MAG TPA: hypothetical protein VMV69_05410 [Pirellulales bacterium]|nr:hypothetical protein [Pirellulales bacterium]